MLALFVGGAVCRFVAGLFSISSQWCPPLLSSGRRPGQSSRLGRMIHDIRFIRVARRRLPTCARHFITQAFCSERSMLVAELTRRSFLRVYMDVKQKRIVSFF